MRRDAPRIDRNFKSQSVFAEEVNILFVCNQGKHRSKTAEELFRDGFSTRSAGLYNEKPIAEQDLVWADIVVVMEDFQRTELSKRFPKQYLLKRIVSLNVPDVYRYNQPELITILKMRMNELVEPVLEPA